MIQKKWEFYKKDNKKCLRWWWIWSVNNNNSNQIMQKIMIIILCSNLNNLLQLKMKKKIIVHKMLKMLKINKLHVRKINFSNNNLWIWFKWDNNKCHKWIKCINKILLHLNPIWKKCKKFKMILKKWKSFNNDNSKCIKWWWCKLNNKDSNNLIILAKHKRTKNNWSNNILANSRFKCILIPWKWWKGFRLNKYMEKLHKIPRKWKN